MYFELLDPIFQADNPSSGEVICYQRVSRLTGAKLPTSTFLYRLTESIIKSYYSVVYYLSQMMNDSS